MGFCYEGRKLVCDHCSKVGGVRKRHCTYRHCPAVALCALCWKVKRVGDRKYHEENCKAKHEAYMRREAEARDLLARGELLCVSAIGLFDGTNRVRVTFQTNGMGYRHFIMAMETYHAFPALANSTLRDYQRIGECVEAA